MRGALLGAAAFAIALLAATWLVPDASTDEADRPLFAATSADAGSRPTWRVGDAWRVQFDAGDPICWLVVAEADEEGYRQGVWCPTDEAPLIAAQLATMPLAYVGDFTPDLRGLAGDGAVTWFDWPLEDGKTWPTAWEGEPARVTANWLDGPQRYELDLCLDDGLCVASYDYDPELRWWSKLSLRGGFDFQVHERDEGWTRGYVLGEAEERSDTRYGGVNLGFVPVGQPVFDVDEGDDVVVVEVAREGIHAHEISLVDPDGSVAWTDSSTSLSDPDEYVWDMVDARSGQWSVRENTVAEGMLHVTVWTVRYSGA